MSLEDGGGKASVVRGPVVVDGEVGSNLSALVRAASRDARYNDRAR